MSTKKVVPVELDFEAYRLLRKVSRKQTRSLNSIAKEAIIEYLHHRTGCIDIWRAISEAGKRGLSVNEMKRGSLGKYFKKNHESCDLLEVLQVAGKIELKSIQGDLGRPRRTWVIKQDKKAS